MKRTLFTLTAVAVWVFFPLSVNAADRLPVIAASLSDFGFKSEITTISESIVPIHQMVLPRLDFFPGKELDFSLNREAYLLTEKKVTSVDKFWLHIRLYRPEEGLTDTDITQGIGRWVAELKNNVNFNCGGIILDVDETCSAEVVKLAISSLSVTFKAVYKDFQLAVRCNIAEALGSTIVVYVDRHVLDVSDISCFQAVQRMSESSLKRPTVLYGDKDIDGDIVEAYLKNYLISLKFQPELFVLPPEQVGDIERLLSTVDQIQASLPLALSLLVDDQRLFAVVAEDGGYPQQAVFIDEMLERVVILADVGAYPAKARPMRFVNQIGENYTLECFDPLRLSTGKGQAFSADSIEWSAAFILMQARRAESKEVRFTDSIVVSAEIDLSVEEIIARWQSYHARQQQMLHNYTADAEVALHFEPPGVGSGFDVTLMYDYFWKDDGSQYWEQTAQYLNGIEIKRNQSFPLPQLEPDKIVTQPLELNLTDNYSYRLEGRAKVRGAECYVISLRPSPGATGKLYSGRVWIDRYSFRRVKMLLVQDSSSGSISSNKEIQFFELIEAPDGPMLNLLVESDVDQIVLAAGREFLLERRYHFNNILINADNYNERLQDAFSGERPMFTEEAEGLRELVKDKNNIRVVQEKVDTFIWSLLVGTIYDGTYDFPIPLLGLSAIDYNFLKSGAQLSTFWAGPILAVNFTKKSNEKITFGSDLYVTALPRNDRVFRSGTEVENEALYFYSENIGIRMSWQPVTDLFIKTTGYLIYEHFRAGDDLADNFIMPRSGFTLNPNLVLEYSHRGYLGEFTLSHYERLGWREWGIPGSGEVFQDSYQRFHGKVIKQFYIGSFTRFGLEIGYYSGFNLDRFSAYQPAVFSTPKIRGFPSGTVSLEKIGIVAGNLGLTIFDFIRFDAYYNYAKCYEPANQGGDFDFHGLEFDFGTVGPWRSYIQGVLSFALAGLPDQYKARWSAYLMIFFPF